jgi:hypothetical protein
MLNLVGKLLLLRLTLRSKQPSRHACRWEQERRGESFLSEQCRLAGQTLNMPGTLSTLSALSSYLMTPILFLREHASLYAFSIHAFAMWSLRYKLRSRNWVQKAWPPLTMLSQCALERSLARVSLLFHGCTHAVPSHTSSKKAQSNFFLSRWAIIVEVGHNSVTQKWRAIIMLTNVLCIVTGVHQ